MTDLFLVGLCTYQIGLVSPQASYSEAVFAYINGVASQQYFQRFPVSLSKFEVHRNPNEGLQKVLTSLIQTYLFTGFNRRQFGITFRSSYFHELGLVLYYLKRTVHFYTSFQPFVDRKK